MITVQDIREKTFEKAKFGGYDMASVDDFLEELADDITASQKENAVLKSKIKVLVDKIEEYRANEEALNMAVISAQKLAVQIEGDARTRASAMLADADRQVKAQIGSISEQADSEEKRLADAKTVSAKFFEGMRSLCTAQLKNIDSIFSTMGLNAEEAQAQPAPAYEPDVQSKASPVAVDDAVRSIENSVARMRPEPQMSIDFTGAANTPAEKPTFNFESTQPFNF